MASAVAFNGLTRNISNLFFIGAGIGLPVPFPALWRCDFWWMRMAQQKRGSVLVESGDLAANDALERHQARPPRAKPTFWTGTRCHSVVMFLCVVIISGVVSIDPSDIAYWASNVLHISNRTSRPAFLSIGCSPWIVEVRCTVDHEH